MGPQHVILRLHLSGPESNKTAGKSKIGLLCQHDTPATWAAVAIMSESKHEGRVTLMVMEQHDRERAKKKRKRKKIDWFTCLDAAQDAIG